MPGSEKIDPLKNDRRQSLGWKHPLGLKLEIVSIRGQYLGEFMGKRVHTTTQIVAE